MTTWINNVFETVLQMSLTASFVCLAVCLLRLLLKRAPKIFSYALWALVFIRLICPVTLGSPMSVVPSRQQWIAWSEMAAQVPDREQTEALRPSAGQQGGQELPDLLWDDRENGRIDGDNVQIGQNVSQAGTASGMKDIVDKQDSTMSRPLDGTEQPTATEDSSESSVLTVAAMLWLVGVIVILSWQSVRTYRWKNSLGQICSAEEGVYTASGATAPFVMGLLHPAIYLPEQMAAEEREYVLLHERTHLRRKDYLVKMVAFMICCVHWFNPFAWLAFRLMCMDMEMSCDEAVLQQMNGQQKKAYATALLSFADRTVSGGSLAFGEPYAKKRIRNVLQYRRTSYRWMLVLTVMCVALAGCLLTDPVDDGSQDGKDVLETQKSEVETKEAETKEPDTTVSETTPSETYQEESEKETTEDDLYFAQMEAYWESFRVGSTAPQITDQSMHWEADLNHDGTPEQIVFDWGYMDMAAPAMFAVLDSHGTVVYMEEPANAHVGWMNYYVCEWDGREYLFSYSPYVSTGILGYYYNLMELDDQGKMVMVDQGNASCILGDGEFIREWHPEEYLNIPQMVEFAAKLNDYLEHSYLLFSTDESWVDLDYAANVLFVTGDPENPYRQYENYGEFSGEPRGSQKPSEGQLKSALMSWVMEMNYPYTEDGVTIKNTMTEDEWFDAWQRHLDSYQVGSTKPQISEKSTSWYADLDHDGVDERIVFDWYFLDNATPGTFAILESDGRVVYMNDLLGTPHMGWMSYYVCQREGKEYLLSYLPYTGTGWGDYSYKLMELSTEGQLQTVEQDDTEFRGDPVEYIRKEWPEYRMDIKDMAVFADGVNELLDNSYLLVSTDQGWMHKELNYTDKGFVLGSEDTPYRQYEDYHGLRGKLLALQATEKPKQGTIYELLKQWCEEVGMPYVQ